MIAVIPRDRSHLYVMERPCEQCLFGPRKLVSDERKADVLEACDRDGTHFTCHVATLQDADAVCAGFYARWPYATPAMRLAALYPDQLLRFVGGRPESAGDACSYGLVGMAELRHGG